MSPTAKPATTTTLDPKTIEDRAYRGSFPSDSGAAQQDPNTPKWLRLRPGKSAVTRKEPTPELGNDQSLFEKSVDRLERFLKLDHGLVYRYYRRANDHIAKHEQALYDLRCKIFKEKRPAYEFERYQIRQREAEIQSLKEKLEVIPRQDRDLYFLFMREKLLELKGQYQTTGIIRTPYVENAIKSVKHAFEDYQMGVVDKSPVLHGPTGSGKTEVAILAAREFSGKDALVVRCYSDMRKEELYGHQALTASNLDYFEVNRAIEQDIAKLKMLSTHSVSDLRKEEQKITRFHLEKAQVTFSQYITGLVYQAMEEGRVVILDEANAMRPGLKISLNDLMKKRATPPNNTVRVQEDGGKEITVQPGFAFCETVNIGSRYGENSGARFKYKADEIRRRQFIEFDLLPQEDRANLGDTPSALKELYTIALMPLLDEQANILGERNSLNKIWDLCRFARVTQLAFNDLLQDNDPRLFRQGSAAPFKVNPPLDIILSPAELQTVIKSWVNEGCVYELDYYLYEKFLTSALSPIHRAYLYQLASDHGFFTSAGWTANPDYGQRGEVLSFKVNVPKNLEAKQVVIDFREVVEAIFGRAPERQDDLTVREPDPDPDSATLSEAERLKILEQANALLHFAASLAESADT